MEQIEDLGAWPVRVCWVLLALLAPVTVGQALDGRSTAVVLTVAIALWAGWAVALVALLVPRDVALTALRILVPGGLAAVAAATVLGDQVGAVDVASVALAALATVGCLAPWVGEAWVDGSSYGTERRFPLRPPALLGYAVVPLTWVLMAAGTVTGPLLLATRHWLFGLLALTLGAAVVAVGVRSLHQLARRWIVLVPAGLVLHDPLAMPDPQLVLRRMITRLGPAPADTEADDLTAGAPGLALQLDLREPIDLLVRGRGRTAETRSSTHLLCTPSRARRVLEAAQEHRIPIG